LVSNWLVVVGTAVIPALRKQSREDHEFKASIGYIARLSQKAEEEDWRRGLSGGVPA
jgi:hypothetical protein